MKFIGAFLSVLIAGLCFSAETFMLSFDEGSFTPEKAGGQAIDQKKIAPAPAFFTTGYNGKKAYTRTENVILSYDCSKNIDLKQGTLSLWVQPVQWLDNRSIRLFHIYAKAKDKKEFFTLTISRYQFNNDILATIHLDIEGTASDTILKISGKQVVNGWQRIDLAWNSEKASLYHNGAIADEKNITSADVFTKVTGGDLQANFNILPVYPSNLEDWASRSAVDDIVISDRPLSASEISASFAQSGYSAVKAPIPSSSSARAAGMYKALPLADKLADKDLTFCVTFDKNSTAADHALGDPESGTFKENLEFRITPGFDMKTSFNIMEGEKLYYRTEKNIDHRQGAVSMWLMAKDYSPKAVNINDPEKTHKSYMLFTFDDGKDWIKIYFYQYFNDTRGMMYWSSSRSKPKVHKLAAANLAKIGQGEWFQLCGTWNQKEIKIFLNGELQSTVALDPEEMPPNFTPDPKLSRIGIRDRMWRGVVNGDDTGKDTVIDDVKIYSRSLTDLEIKNQYMRVLSGAAKQIDIANIDIQLHGVDDGGGDLDRLEVTIDLSALDADWQKEIRDGSARASYSITTPSKKTISGIWDSKKISDMRIISGISEPGEYQFAMKIVSPRGKTESAVKKVLRPDTSWFGNMLGKEDAVPEPWTPITIDEKNTVRMWGREYQFSNGPFPSKVLHGGESILAGAPEFIFMTPEGRAEVSYRITDKVVKNSFIGLKGTGTAKGFTLTWKTKVEFDGYIRTDIVISGRPILRSMKLAWTVDRTYSDYLLTPLLSLSGNGSFETIFPVKAGGEGSALWFTSAEKGFSWSPEHDGNWVYDKASKPIRASISDRGGACEVDMITREVAVPEGASYHAMFIATPSRPLPKRSRSYRLGGYGRQPNCDVSIIQHVGEGTESVFTLKPSKYFDEVVEFFKGRKIKSAAPYGGATALNNYAPEGKYFGKYWEIAGSGNVPFPLRPGIKREDNEEQILQINCDPRTSYSDLILANIKTLFDHPKGSFYSAMYYDLCHNYVNGNELNGAGFTDTFGRKISRFIIVGLRDHLKRTMKYCHSVGRDTIYHDHSYYNPLMHAFGDYFYPGEQYCSTMQAKKTPYVYSDIIPDDEYRTELNMHIKGSGILFLGNLSRAEKAYGGEEQTKAMCTKLLLNDVPVTMAFEDSAVINRIWGAFMRYEMDSAAVHYYYRQKEITASNPAVAVTYYTCAGGKTLAVIGNITAVPQRSAIDLGGVKKNPVVTDEYEGRPIAASGSTITVDIPARHFMIIGF